MLELQKYLRDGHTVADLTTNFPIKSSFHSNHPNLVLFKYNKIDCDFNVQMTREARGVILDANDNWNLVNYSFMKFFNFGEGLADKIDWKDIKIQEKLDGSLMQLWSYNGKWYVSTSGTADASGQVNDFGFSFEELFWKIFKSYDQDLPDPNLNISFTFEMMSLYNKIVVTHPEPKLTIIGARNLNTGKEISAEEAGKYFPKIPVVKEYTNFFSIEDLIATLATMPLNQEGYICLSKNLNEFGNFSRFKLKSPAYVAAHHLKSGLSSNRSLVTVILAEEVDEVSLILPEYKDILFNLNEKYKALVDELTKEYDKIKDVETQKEFAGYAVLSKCSSALFGVRNKKSASIKEHLTKMNVDSIVQLLGLRTDK